jgi:hypothetical protein
LFQHLIKSDSCETLKPVQSDKKELQHSPGKGRERRSRPNQETMLDRELR